MAELTPALAKAVTDQVTLELKASLVYLQLAIELDHLDLPGMAGWMRAQSEEEQVHAAKFIQHALDRGHAPAIGAIEPEELKADSPAELFEAALAHEEKVSAAIRELYRTAQSEGDLDILPLLHWFIDEQVEEEASVGQVVAQLRLIGDDGAGLLRMDAKLGERSPEITPDHED
ncbi:ferritin [Sediminivirga luteola]|uniref:Ferritin n=1 Tax=Sediminivirga luteola TaxID=1774748 RepID=A0A8J2U091_9MICO|nr:ferritin [Sediminivirga luteola]MCI2264021.1 ferritin [Sediminivirga luteola]GGA22993.1 ferritin [Sediminivirga luteola]